MSNWRQSMPTPEAYWLGKVLFELHHKADDLEAYKRDPEGYLRRYPLTERMKQAIMQNDVAGLYLSGVNPYLLRAHCIGMSIPEKESLAALRGAAENADG
jgi:Aromatic-ring-opening dioxygenase LigAB, LigA subunit